MNEIMHTARQQYIKKKHTPLETKRLHFLIILNQQDIPTAVFNIVQ